MSGSGVGAVPGTPPHVWIEPALRARLTALAGGRHVVLDFFTTRRCGVTLGDMTAGFRREAPGSDYVELAGTEGVRLFARKSLILVLTDSAVTLRLGRLLFARRLGVDLEPASRWIEFLEHPARAD